MARRFIGITWLLFMQPQFLAVRGIGTDFSACMDGLSQGRRGEFRHHLYICLWMGIVVPVLVAVTALLWSRLVQPIAFDPIAISIILGWVAWHFLGAALGMSIMLAGLGVNLIGGIHTVLHGRIFGISLAIWDWVVRGTIIGAVIGLLPVAYTVRARANGAVLSGMAVAGLIYFGLKSEGWMYCGLAVTLTYLRLPFYVIEATWTALLPALLRRRPGEHARLAAWLPYVHHDLIHLPLPRLRRFLDMLPAGSLREDLLLRARMSLAQKGAGRMMAPIECWYVEEDAEHARDLCNHLQGLSELVDWYQIPGPYTYLERKKHVKAILLLCSAKMLATRAFKQLSQHPPETQECRVVPIQVRPVEMIGWLSHLQAVPRGGSTIADSPSVDAAWKAIVKDLRNDVFAL